MRLCPKDAKLHLYACWALANIIWSESAVKTKALELGTTQILENVISRFSSHNRVIDKAHMALSKLREVEATQSPMTIVPNNRFLNGRNRFKKR